MCQEFTLTYLNRQSVTRGAHRLVGIPAISRSGFCDIRPRPLRRARRLRARLQPHLGADAFAIRSGISSTPAQSQAPRVCFGKADAANWSRSSAVLVGPRVTLVQSAPRLIESRGGLAFENTTPRSFRKLNVRHDVAHVLDGRLNYVHRGRLHRAIAAITSSCPAQAVRAEEVICERLWSGGLPCRFYRR